MSVPGQSELVSLRREMFKRKEKVMSENAGEHQSDSSGTPPNMPYSIDESVSCPLLIGPGQQKKKPAAGGKLHFGLWKVPFFDILVVCGDRFVQLLLHILIVC